MQALKLSGLDVSQVNGKAVTWRQHQEDQAWVRKQISTMKSLGATVVDFDEVLCRYGEICPLAMDGKSLYYDSDHLSVHGAMLLYPVIKATLSKNETFMPQAGSSLR